MREVLFGNNMRFSGSEKVGEECENSRFYSPSPGDHSMPHTGQISPHHTHISQPVGGAGQTSRRIGLSLSACKALLTANTVVVSHSAQTKVQSYAPKHCCYHFMTE